MKKFLVMLVAMMGLGVSLTAGAVCPGQQEQMGPFVYSAEEHR